MMSRSPSGQAVNQVSPETRPRSDRPAEGQSTAVHGPNGTLNDNEDFNNGAATSNMRTPGSEFRIAYTIRGDADKRVRRKLRSIHLFMITINGTFGTGLYLRSGQILELGGPIAVLVSFILLGFLAWTVMQCITELLCIWPVPGALPLFVRKFVDKELGIAVGVAYWFCYSVIFAATIAAAASSLNYWNPEVPGFTVGVVYVALPLVLVGINTLKVEIFGWFEVVTGFIKISFLFIITVSLIVIHGKNGIDRDSEIGWNEPVQHDEDVAFGWAQALFICLSIAAYAYVGVEIVAVSAIEARWPSTSQQTDDAWRSAGNTIKFAAVSAPIAIAFGYILSGMLVSIDLRRTTCELPRLSWIESTECPSQNNSMSPFVIVAKNYDGTGSLGDAFNAFILFTALTSANTSLYVASRTLFGLTRNIRGSGIILKSLSWFGKTDRNSVPLRAMLLSAVTFCWVPFVREGDRGFENDSPIGMFFEILGQLGAVSVIIVWACQCLAYIRFHRCIYEHREFLEQEGIHLARDRKQGSANYPFRNHLQPVLAYLALIGCIIVLVVCNGAYLWKEFHFFPFLSGYLPIFVFLALWCGLKVFHEASWSFVHLNEANAKRLIEDLDELLLASMTQPESASESRWASIRRMFAFGRDDSQLRNQTSRR